MITISRTPLRVSFFGGGTDYPEYFTRGRGAVLGMAIDKYIYISVLRLSSVIDYHLRLSYSRIETVVHAEELEHPVVRNVLQHFGMREPLDLSILADLPARSGLGSSSSFTVGLINLVHCLQRRPITKLELARTAIFVERELLGENVGVQDQHHASFGGLNRFEFSSGRTRIEPVQMMAPCQSALTSSLFLVYTGATRLASQTLQEQLHRTVSRAADASLSHLLALVDQSMSVLEGHDPDRTLAEFGEMLHDGWETKKTLSSKVSNVEIDTLYEAARAAGACGGKLCGAGSGGFLLMLVPPERQPRFLQRMSGTAVIPVGMDTVGATILTG
jgi:D-glycero-alpha-D-manno-heptose-7-phosphate kinase